MPRKQREFFNDEIYHIVLRGVEQREIFLDDNDYFRGIFSLYEFNNTDLVLMRDKRVRRTCRGQTPTSSPVNRDKWVDILAFALMPNHIHLLARQLKERGISNFVQKFGSGYVCYFNNKHSRVGHLFQGRFRSVHIEDNDQLKNVFVYIHTNPISLIEPGWKEKGIVSPDKVKVFLGEYKWSSYLDYIGGKAFPSLTEREFLGTVMGGQSGCQKFVDDWVDFKGEIVGLGGVNIE